jgi:hypothetical protein
VTGARLVCVVTLFVAGVSAQAGWQADPDVVARTSAAQPTFNYDEARVRAYSLPSVLGTGLAPVRSAADWPARRAEVLGRFRDHVYGRSPGRPSGLRFEVIERDSAAMAGAATLARVAITSAVGARTHRFVLTLFTPNGRGRVPAFLFLNNRPESNTDPTRKEKSGFWPAEQIIAAGFAIAAIQNNELAPDDKERFREGVIRLFEGEGQSPRPVHAWGAVAAWAWGASRALDYLVTDPRIDGARVAVVGHSRGGKAALWAGAEDERFAMVVSNESGESGAALSRRWYGETVSRINDSFPHWFNATYKTYGGREASLPVDQHLLLALVAPRLLYVASADEDLWSDPRGEFLSLAAASPAFTLWGDPVIRADAMPPLETPLAVGRRGYHIRRGEHNLTPYDWAQFTAFAAKGWPQMSAR